MTQPLAGAPPAAAPPRGPGRHPLLRLALAGVAVGFFLWLLTRLPLLELVAQWRALPPALIAAALAGQLLSYVLRAQRVRAVLPSLAGVSLMRCLRVTLIHNALNILLPMRSGEASFPLLLKQRFGVALPEALGALVWLRVADLSVLCAVGFACAVAIGGQARGGTAVGIALVLGASLPALAWLGARLLRALDAHGRLVTLLRAAPHSPGLAARSVLLTWACWLPKLAALGFVLAALAQASLPLGLLGVIGGDLSTVLPIHAPGGIGTYEAGVLALVFPNAPGNVVGARWVGAAINVHALLLGVALSLGLIAAAWREAPR